MRSIIRLIVIKLEERYMDMKILIIMLFLVVFTGLLIGNSYADTEKTKNNSDVEIFMQTVVRNLDGTMVGYTEGTPQIFHIDKVIDWMEQRASKSTIIKDGKKFEMLQVVTIFNWPKNDPENGFAMGAYTLDLPINGQTVNILYFHHDSFNTLPGDTAQIFWTVFRPAD